MYRLIVILSLAACSGGPDGRLTANLYADTCFWRGDAWLGIENLEVTLEVSPGALAVRDLPALVGQCSLDLPLFATEVPPAEGEEIPGLDGTPRWASDIANGLMEDQGLGLWRSARKPEAGCQALDEVASDGIRLEDAGVFDGLTTPFPGTAEPVLIDGDREDVATKPVVKGNSMDVSWDAQGWPESFVQLRALSQGRVRQTLTCNTTGLSEFAVSAVHWDQLDAAGTDQAQIFVGFQATSMEKVSGFGETETVTRLVVMLGENET